MASQKIYVIDEPRRAATRPASEPASRERIGATGRAEPAPPKPGGAHWALALRAYALGPLNIVLWPAGRGRVAWAALGAISLVATACLLVWWERYFFASAQSTGGALRWSASVGLVLVLACIAWARSIALSVKPARWPRWAQKAGVMGALGLILPGSGLLMAGRRLRAAAAVLTVGTGAVTAVIAMHWLKLSGILTTGDGALSQVWFEGVLAATCMIAGVALITWLIQALDALRLTSPVSRSGRLANALALSLVAALIAFAAFYRPEVAAGSLDSTARYLEGYGLRYIPIALHESADRVEPANPEHLVNAAALRSTVGLHDTANARLEILRERAARYAEAAGARLTPAPSSSRAPRQLDYEDHVIPHTIRPTDQPLRRTAGP